MNGLKNCDRYSDAEMSGMTVVAAALPSFAEADEMINGTPTPLAKADESRACDRSDPAADKGEQAVADQEQQRRDKARAFAAYALFTHTNARPPPNATRSVPAMITAHRLMGIAPSAAVTMAKFAG